MKNHETDPSAIPASKSPRTSFEDIDLILCRPFSLTPHSVDASISLVGKGRSFEKQVHASHTWLRTTKLRCCYFVGSRPAWVSLPVGQRLHLIWSSISLGDHPELAHHVPVPMHDGNIQQDQPPNRTQLGHDEGFHTQRLGNSWCCVLPLFSLL